MDNISLDDIWDGLIESEAGHVTLTLPSMRKVNTLKSQISSKKFQELKRTPGIKTFLGEFNLRFKVEQLEGSRGIVLHIYRELPSDSKHHATVIGKLDIL